MNIKFVNAFSPKFTLQIHNRYKVENTQYIIYSIQYTRYNIQYTVHNILGTNKAGVMEHETALCSKPGIPLDLTHPSTPHSPQCTWHTPRTTHYTPTTLFNIHTPHCTLHTTQWIMHSSHSNHYTLQIPHSSLNIELKVIELYGGE